ncbi:MAG: hypothetical protein V5786_04230 [Psychromonas sp.]
MDLIQSLQKQPPLIQSSGASGLLKGHSPLESAAIFTSLLLTPSYQSNTITIEKAIYTSLSECNGKYLPTKRYIKRVFKGIHSSGLGMMEDPAEDVMASLLWFLGKPYKVLLGAWEGAIEQTQAFLNTIERMAKENDYSELCNCVKAQLIASNTVLNRFSIPINTITADYPLEEIKSRDILDIEVVLERLEVTNLDLSDKLPICDENLWKFLGKAEPGNTLLEKSPYLLINDKRYLILPTAITLSIRRAIFSYFIEFKMLDMFKSELLSAHTKMLQGISIFRESELKNIPIHYQRIPEQKNFLLAQSSIEFDSGYHYLFLFVSDALEGFQDSWFQDVLSFGEGVSDFLSDRINYFSQEILKLNPDAKFCTFIIPCGYGRGIGGMLGFEEKDWLVEVVSFHDLMTLSQDSDCNPQRIWRLVEAVNILKNYGGRVQNFNGFLNLYGYVKGNDFSIFNHSDFIDMESSSLQIFVGTNFQKTIRESVLQDENMKIIKHPECDDITIKRGYPHSLFKQNDMRNIYCPLNMRGDLFQIVICHKDIELWVEIDVIENIEISLQVQLFEAYIKWIAKVVDALTLKGISIEHIKLVHLEINYPKNYRNTSLKVSNESVLNSFSFELDDSVLECSYSENLYYGFSLPENVSERALLRPFIIKACKGNEEHINQVSQLVFKNKYARYAHFFQSNTYSEHVIGSFERESPITLEIAADHNTKFGLGWIGGVRPENNTIEGKINCTNYLGQVVGETWDKLKSKLNLLNKSYLVETLLRNIEVCDLHKTRWTRTFKANKSLIEDQEDLYQVASKEIGLLNGATIVSRLLIEMAICECPTKEGKQAGKMDIQELQSYAMSMHLLGGVSDAIKYDAIAPKLVISLFGDVLFDHDFEDFIVQRYQYGLQERQFDNAVQKHSELFKVEKQNIASKEEVEGEFDKQFWDAWVQEFGFDINQGIDFINIIQEHGYGLEKLIFKLKRQDLYGLFSSWDEVIVDAIVDCLQLSSRKNWVKIPKPYKSTDWQPWRYKRRYSISFKPLVYLKEEDTFIISPQHLLRSYFHLLRNSFEATIDENHFNTKEMITWNGTKKGKEGLEFNSKVAVLFDQDDWVVEEEIKLTKILNKKLKDFGDVDVFAWHKTKKIVLAIECKDLELAKTQGEIAKQLYEFKGKVNEKGKSDRLHKHMLRLDELNNNIDGVATYCNNMDLGDIKIIGMVVFSFLVPMHFSKENNSGMIITDIDSLMDEVEEISN